MEKAHIITHSTWTAEGELFMTKNIYYVGLDIAADHFVASIYQSPQKPVITKEGFENTFDGMNYPAASYGVS